MPLVRAALPCLVALSLVALSCAPPPPRPPPIPGFMLRPPPPTLPVASPAAPEPRAHRFAVAAEHPDSARAAIAVLEAGGSAADAVIAAMLVAGVVQPVSSGLGGGGMMLYWDAAAGRATALDFRETAPAGLRPRDYDVRPPPDSKRGLLVGVPGEMAGIAEMHRRWGKRPLAELFRPAIERAEQGFSVSHHLRRALRWNKRWILGDPHLARRYAPGGRLLDAGNLVQNPELGATLRAIAAGGPAVVYGGPVGADIVAGAAAAGSRLALADLQGYRVIERAPVTVSWAGRTIYGAPPPSGGGLLLAETLLMHPAAELEKLGYGSGPYLHLLAETFRGAIADRMRAIGDPAFGQTDLAGLLAPERLAARRSRISPQKTNLAEAFPLHEKGTTNLVVVDAAGNVACVTTSVRSMFGARLVTTGGVVLNDALSDFVTLRDQERYGAKLQPNIPRAGARPATSITPTLVVKDGAVRLALGASGGEHMPGAVTQVLLAVELFGRTPAEAVSDRRIRTPAAGGLLLEPGSKAELLADLRARGEIVRADQPDYSAVSLLVVSRRDGARRIEAAADPRKGGTALVR